MENISSVICTRCIYKYYCIYQRAKNTLQLAKNIPLESYFMCKGQKKNEFILKEGHEVFKIKQNLKN